ncbi:MAG: 1-acyl-sn-glycerol-3-phosphate acyltransferase [Candidatus Enteromonas sp.]|nr:1-acyl-sn-glycerol-3-phosphate acyltransferase [Candidatus Enteromonas sp.]
MFLLIILALIAFGLQGLQYWTNGWYLEWYMFWTWIVFPIVFILALFAAYLIILFLVGALLGTAEPKKPSKFAKWIIEQTVFIVMLFLRLRLHTSGLGKLPSRKTPVMIVHNHLSTFDEFAMIWAFRHHGVLFISKEANFHIPIAGNWIRKAGYLSILQGDLVNGKATIEKAVGHITSGKNSICVAPEGTRNKDFPNPQLLPFHPGTFNLAKDAHCPIVVVALQNTYAVSHRFPLKRTDVYLDVVGVIDPSTVDAKSSTELADMSRNLILKRFEDKGARFYHLEEKKKPEVPDDK